MPLMKWFKNYELGIKVIDDHHKHLLGLLNKVFDDLTSGVSQESLCVVIDQLVDYAKYHFSTEEHWMLVHEYPGLAKHREEHEIFTNRVVAIQDKFHNEETNLFPEVLQFLQNWLSYHILKTDAEYGRFAKGLPPVSMINIQTEIPRPVSK
jgi:hemerythrin